MDELCAMMKETSVMCCDDNNINLKKSFIVTKNMLANMNYLQLDTVAIWLKDTKKRYNYYQSKLSLRGSLRYIQNLIKDTVTTIENLEEYGLDNYDEDFIKRVFYQTYIIDSQLLLAIGEMVISDDIEPNNEIDESMDTNINFSINTYPEQCTVFAL